MIVSNFYKLACEVMYVCFNLPTRLIMALCISFKGLISIAWFANIDKHLPLVIVDDVFYPNFGWKDFSEQWVFLLDICDYYNSDQTKLIFSVFLKSLSYKQFASLPLSHSEISTVYS